MDQLGRRLSIRQGTQWAAGLILTALIIYLHITFMQNAGAFWRDEINTIQMAAMPSLSHIWANLHLDSFPLLPTLVLRLWSKTGWGATYTGLRTLGLLIGLAILGAIWLNARLLGHRVPLISLALFGFTSLLVRTGDAVRPYGLGLFFILLAFGLIWKVVEEPSPRRTFAAALASVLSVQCLYTNAFMLLAILIGGALVTMRGRLWKRTMLLISMGVASAISLVPYVGTIQRAGEWAPLTRFPTTYRILWKTLTEDTLGAASGYMTLVWGALFLLAILMAAYKNIRDSRGRRTEARRALFLATIIFVSTIEFFVLYKSMHAYPFPRYFFIPLAIAALSLDNLLGGTKPLWSMGRVLIVILIIVLTFSSVTKRVRMRQTNMDLVAARLEKAVSKNDLVLLDPWFFAVSFNRYYRGNAPWTSVPHLEDTSIHRYDLLKKKMASTDPLAEIREGITRTLRRGDTVWLVGDLVFNPYRPMTPPRVFPPAPSGPYGWESGPYLWSWKMQVLYLITSRASNYKTIVSPSSEGTNPYENPSLIAVWGWRGQP